MNHSGASYVVDSTEIDYFVMCFAWKDSAVFLIVIIVLQCHHYAVTTITIVTTRGVHTSCGKLSCVFILSLRTLCCTFWHPKFSANIIYFVKLESYIQSHVYSVTN
jgi:hypothetical protein